MDDILKAFGLNLSDFHIQKFGSGLINKTLKVYGDDRTFVLQEINKEVFKSPEDIAENLRLIEVHLQKKHPDYQFTAPLPAISGKYLVKSTDDKYFRLLPFVYGSHTIDFIEDPKEAFEAARQFGKFTKLLNNFDTKLLKYTLPDFHNLTLRFEQFESSLKNATALRMAHATDAIKDAYTHSQTAVTYRQIIKNHELPLRVIHHDTKINNVLFDDNNNGLCVIDLDTVMPGYFISDVGDMMRTYLSPANEEEKDLTKIHIREDFFKSIYKGYMSEMGNVLTSTEKQYFLFSGRFMIYMQALRFLTDFLNNDIYYGSAYPGHNLNRAQNQFMLLNKYIRAEVKFEELIIEAEKEL